MIIQETESFISALCKSKRIAIVCSGPLLPSMGGEIDAHDVVIRINFFNLESQIDLAGERLNCWMHNGHLEKSVPQFSTVPYVVTKWYGGPLVPQFNEMHEYYRSERMYFFYKENSNGGDGLGL